MGAPSSFGVTPDTVRQHFFPHINAFSANTAPSTSVATVKVQWAAARLDAALRQKLVSPASIADATSAAYLWCAETLSLDVAVRLARIMTGADPKVAQAWEGQLAARYLELTTRGAAALGDGAVSTGGSNSAGPSSHVTQYGLATDEAGDVSSVTARLRRDDEL